MRKDHLKKLVRLTPADEQFLEAMDSAVRNAKSDVLIPNALSNERAFTLHWLFYVLNPDLYHMTETMHQMFTIGSIRSMVLTSNALTADDAKKKTTETRSETKRLVKDLQLGEKTDHGKALAIADYLAKTVTYDLNAPNKQSAYGALIDKRAVCEGFAYAFDILAKACGLPAISVNGRQDGEGHAWNMALINGAPYMFDVTSHRAFHDSCGNFDFLFLNDQDMSSNWVWDRSFYATCNESYHNYYVVTRSLVHDERELEAVVQRQFAARKAICVRFATGLPMQKFSEHTCEIFESLCRKNGILCSYRCSPNTMLSSFRISWHD